MKKYFIIFVSFFIFIIIVYFLSYSSFFLVDIKILQKCEYEDYSIILYEIDPGARGSKTINLSIGKKINMKHRGNIYCSTLPESSLTFFEVLDDCSKICIYVKERKNEILLMKTQFENFIIEYH